MRIFKRVAKNGFCIVVFAITFSMSGFAQLNYSMTPSNPGYTPLSGGTFIGDLASGSDQTISSDFPIGFNFEFDGTIYTDVQASDNGYLHFGNDLAPTGYGNAGGDLVIPNDFSDASATTPGVNTTRPFVAPLWEELAIAGIGGGGASYLTTGIAPNRTFTVEWDRISWRAPTATDQISFQVVLHETTNVIDFVYLQGSIALGNLPTASIGLAGITNGDYYSLSDSGPNPTASKTVNTTSINTKPATGQMYTWTPFIATNISSYSGIETLSSVYFDSNSNYLKITDNFSQTGDFTFEMLDLLGRSVYKDKIQITVKGETKLQFLIPSCSAGIYIAKISGANSVRQSKFIKE